MNIILFRQVVNSEIKLLLELKEEYKKVTGVAWSPTPGSQAGNVTTKKVVEKNATEKSKKPKQVS